MILEIKIDVLVDNYSEELADQVLEFIKTNRHEKILRATVTQIG